MRAANMVACHEKHTPALAADGERQSLVEPVRDTVIDPHPPTRWGRVRAAVSRFADSFLDAFFGRRYLSNDLPPVRERRSRSGTRLSVGAEAECEQGELMLLWILRSTAVYQDAAIETARCALAARQAGEEAYTDFVVHFVVSRTRPDENALISITRLREAVMNMPRLGSLSRSLIRLEKRGFVNLILDNSGGDPMTEILREKITHVELVVPI